MNKIGLIPAAGYARRLKNLSCSKEMIPVDYGYGVEPVCQSLLRQFNNADIKDIVVVTRPDKTDLVAHLRDNIHSDLNIEIVLLESSSSTLESICSAYTSIQGRDVYLGFPDMILSPLDAVKRLVNFSLRSNIDVALGAFQSDYPERFDMVSYEKNGNLRNIKIKDKQCHYDWTWILASWNSKFTRYIMNAYSELNLENNEEVYLGSLFNSYMVEGNRIKVLPMIDGSFADLGTPGDLKYIERLRKSLP